MMMIGRWRFQKKHNTHHHQQRQPEEEEDEQQLLLLQPLQQQDEFPSRNGKLKWRKEITKSHHDDKREQPTPFWNGIFKSATTKRSAGSSSGRRHDGGGGGGGGYGDRYTNTKMAESTIVPKNVGNDNALITVQRYLARSIFHDYIATQYAGTQPTNTNYFRPCPSMGQMITFMGLYHSNPNPDSLSVLLYLIQYLEMVC